MWAGLYPSEPAFRGKAGFEVGSTKIELYKKIK